MSISARTAWSRVRKITSDEWLFFAFFALFFSMPLGTSPPTICAALATLIWIFSGKITKIWDTSLKKTWFWPVLLLMILPWVGLLYTPDVGGLGIKFAKKTHYWVYCMAVASIGFGAFPPHRLIQAFLMGLTFNVLVGIAQFAGLVPVQQGLKGMYSGLGLQYSTLSTYLVVGVLMASFYFKKAADKKSQAFFLFLALLYFFHLIILEGRAGYLSFLILCPLVVHNFLKKFSRLQISLVCIALLASMFISPVVRDRVSLSIDEVKYHLNADPEKAWGREYTANQDRFSMWYAAVRIFSEHPILGVGTGGYQTVIKEMLGPEWPLIAHPHSNILYMAVSFGVIGIFALLWFFWEIIKNSLKERHTALGFFVLSTALVIFTSGLVNTQIKDAGTLLLLAVVTGLQNGLQRFNHSAVD